MSVGGLHANNFQNGTCRFPKRTCEANPAGESSSFILAVFVKSVSLYHFKLAYVVLHMAVKEFFENPFLKIVKYSSFKNRVIFTDLENQLQCTAEFVSKALKD